MVYDVMGEPSVGVPAILPFENANPFGSVGTMFAFLWALEHVTFDSTPAVNTIVPLPHTMVAEWHPTATRTSKQRNRVVLVIVIKGNNNLYR